jgi:hypothetical protein
LRWKVDWLGDKDLKHAACTEVGTLLIPRETESSQHGRGDANTY